MKDDYIVLILIANDIIKLHSFIYQFAIVILVGEAVLILHTFDSVWWYTTMSINNAMP